MPLDGAYSLQVGHRSLDFQLIIQSTVYTFIFLAWFLQTLEFGTSSLYKLILKADNFSPTQVELQC